MAGRVKPVTRLGLLGPAQPHGLSWTQPKKINKKNKKIENKKICVFMNKNNINFILLVYSLTLESGIKILI
jgi:hypothetical protein